MSSGSPAPEDHLARVRGRRLSALVASLLLTAMLLVGAVRSAPALLDRYGYREVERKSIGVWPSLELRFDRRRASWLPIPRERLRVENARGEEVARLRSDAKPPLTGTFWTRLMVQSSGAGVELDWLGERRAFHPDSEGVLVPEGSLTHAERPPEEAYRGFDGLRLVPDPD